MGTHSEVDVVVIGVGTRGEDPSLHVLDAPGHGAIAADWESVAAHVRNEVTGGGDDAYAVE